MNTCCLLSMFLLLGICYGIGPDRLVRASKMLTWLTLVRSAGGKIKGANTEKPEKRQV